MAGFVLEGADEFLETLNRKLGEASDRVVNNGLKKAGEIIKASMVSKAPKSDSPRQPAEGTQNWRTGGHAADGIKLSRIVRKDGEKYLLVGIQRGDNSKYFYLKFFEYGTSKMSARPWAYPAFYESKDAALAVLGEEFRKGLMEG